ncbi:CBS domain containing-hemolysin-like protein [Scopulibacillus darangshiensis]|uniref:CBS domain containing-hemolysin-like protein n=1 Tax=Scopulibacillus darangshiensis TaxID=442528 RepID=A0A4R2P905_9BACL|nr:hemolysin family protein [Scopulibacillus darangshiensis]TCP30541.1 CBS domain containing-hemolysin-like protein [Scopulibacillus darangshiensis]
MTIINIAVLIVLILLTAFFVSTEFAIVKVRKTKIDTLAEEGDKKAIAAQKVLNKLDAYLSACQLGITMTALGIGWLGEPTIGHYLELLFGYFPLSDAIALTLSVVLAFVVITIIHVVLGELAPKTLAIQQAEKVTLSFARPLIAFNYVMYPFIWVLNGSAILVAKLFGAKPISEQENVHTEEELRLLLSESYESGEINQSEYRYVNRIFEFDDRIAREIMVPRTEVVCLYQDRSLEENIGIMRNEKYTRYPVVKEDKDHVIGVVNIKELFHASLASRQDLQNFIRPMISVLETMPIKKLLVKMQKERVHMAVLIDEYGGTSGIVTVEDILEEIVGEIRDEFDEDEEPMLQKNAQDDYIVDGKMLIDDLNHLLKTDLQHEEVDTIGGYILSEKDDVDVGTIVETNDVILEVLEAEGTQIKKVSIKSVRK